MKIKKYINVYKDRAVGFIKKLWLHIKPTLTKWYKDIKYWLDNDYNSWDIRQQQLAVFLIVSIMILLSTKAYIKYQNHGYVFIKPTSTNYEYIPIYENMDYDSDISIASQIISDAIIRNQNEACFIKNTIAYINNDEIGFNYDFVIPNTNRINSNNKQYAYDIACHYLKYINKLWEPYSISANIVVNIVSCNDNEIVLLSVSDNDVI